MQSSEIIEPVEGSSSQSNECSSLTLVKYLLTINKAYKESIDEKLASLKQKLEQNRRQQNEIINEISTTQKSASKSTNKKAESDSSSIKKNESELFKIKLSYFKDRYGSEPEENLDTHRKNKLIIRDCTPQCKNEWTVVWRTKLKDAVLKDSLRVLKLPITTKVAYLEEKLYELMKTQSYSNNDLKVINKQKRVANKLETKIDQYDEDQVLNHVDPKKLDWMKISKVDLKGNWSATECYLVWMNVCHPKINQQKWTPNEDRELIDLARKYREKNWEKIAQELGSNRTAFLCIKRYHEKTGEKYCKRDWSDKESKELCELAEKHRIGLYVPYNYLCYLNGTRDRNNIYNFHLKVDPNLNHGKWTPSEEQAFEEALQFYNTVFNWQEISEYIGTRTSFQCKDRYELKYYNPEKYINWTSEDDKKLLDAYKQYENQWVKIAKYVFPNRNDNACLHRYSKLMNWKLQNEWFQKQPPEIKEFILFLCRKNRTKQNQIVMYTDDGEPVPTRPVFAQNLGNIIHKIYEKKDLVYEFVHKMRQGQLSLTLLSKIGVYTHTLNMIIKKYQKHNFSQTSKPLENIKKIKAKLNTITSIKSLKKDTNRKQQNRRKKSINLPNDVSNEPTTSPSTTPTTSNVLNKVVKKSAHIRDMEITQPTDPKSLNEHIKLYQSLSLNLNKNVSLINPSKRNKAKKISELLTIVNENSNNETENLQNLQNTTSEVTMVKKVRTKRTRTDQNETSEPKAKKVKKINSEKPKTTTETTIKTSQPEQTPEITALKEMKINEINQLNLKRNVQSPLVVDLNSIPDGEKIPCVNEQLKTFKFMYSLRKETNNSKYFYKYSIIKWNDMYVAVKPCNGQVTDDYLNETRLNSIEQALKHVLNMPKKK